MANKKSAQQEPLPYPVTPEWCERVRDALGDDRGAHRRLREHLGISSGHLADILAGKYKTSPYVGPIHTFLGWEPPLPPTASLDAGELVHLFQRMTPAQREDILNAAHILTGSSSDASKTALVALLKALGAAND